MQAKKKKTFLIFTIILLASIYSLIAPSENTDHLKDYIYNCEYDKAITLAESILNKPFLSKEVKINVYLKKGIAEFSSNRILDSKITFTKLLALDNQIKMNPNDVSPKIIDVFNDLRNGINKTNRWENEKN